MIQADFVTRFWRIALITVLAVYLLIFVGGVVRAAGGAQRKSAAGKKGPSRTRTRR